MSALIHIRALNHFYRMGEQRVQVLKDINLEIETGDFVAIIGQSGSGKTTLMNMLGCLDTPSQGSYCVLGEETAHLNADQLAALRRKTFGFIFQRYHLINSLSTQENVALPAAYAGVEREKRLQRAAELLREVGLAEKIHHRPNELSGGQQQRVSIARALINGGAIILADEPTGALDSASGDNVMHILGELHQKGHTVIVVTHDAHIAAYADRVIEIKDGCIIRDERCRPLHAAETIHPRPERLGWRFVFEQIAESLHMARQAIFAHKMRSLLTMLGIIIGIASVVCVVALGTGSQQKILEQINAMGTNTIDIYPGENFGDVRAARVKTLNMRDAQALAQQSYTDSISPNSNSSGMLTYRNHSLSVQLSGVGEEYFRVKGISMAQGRGLSAEEVQHAAQLVVIDHNTQRSLFSDGRPAIGEVIFFNRRPLQIIGVTEKQENAWGNPDRLHLWTPYTTVMQKITGARNISSLTLKLHDDAQPKDAETELTKLLTHLHGKKDFFTINSDSIRQTVESTTNVMRLLISSIALIALIVGGIGVMNIMLVSVTERTHEIGIRMAIGARQSNIMQQFLIEAVLICLLGGIIGISLSLLIGLGFNHVVKDFPMRFSGGSIILALSCASLIGIIFGFMPARNAARLNPIRALSHD